MQTENTRNQNGWMVLSGRILPGGYELQDLLEADEDRALFKARVLGDREIQATARVFQLPDSASARQIEIWETIRALRDPSLNAPLGSGHVDMDGSGATYVVLRQPDESLAGVLQERPLTAAEANEAFLSAAKGLEVLHLSGLTHGTLSPEQILAIGNSIRLSGECARVLGAEPPVDLVPAKYLAPESKGQNVTLAADLWCFGAALFEALTQKSWTEESREEAAALPEPFATVALRCLEEDPRGRCQLAEAVALLKGEIKPAPRPKVKSAAAASSSAIVVPESALTGSPGPAAPSNGRVPDAAKSSEERLADPPATATALAAASPVRKLEPEASTAAVSALGPEAQARTVAPATSSPAEARPASTTGAVPVKASALSKDASPGPIPINSSGSPSSAKTVTRAEDSEEPATKMWIWAGIALLAVLAFIWALRPKSSNTPRATGPSRSAVAAPSEVRRNTNSWETRTIQPDGTASKPTGAANPARISNPTPAPAAPKPAHVQESKPVPEDQTRSVTSTARADLWRVILYTYNQQSAAEARAKVLNEQHPDLHAEVFSPSGGSHYLVTAGGRMTRDEATQLRRQAVGSGMPHDTYIQNFSK